MTHILTFLFLLLCMLLGQVFSQFKLREFIERGEHLLFSPSRPSPQMGSQMAASSNIKAVFVKCEGAMFHYNSLFDQNTLELVSSAVLYSIFN